MAMEQREHGRIKILDELTVEIQNEGHTLINPLKWVISNNWSGNDVEFCGYNVPHPSDDLVHMLIQFSNEANQTNTNLLLKLEEAADMVAECCDKLLLEINTPTADVM